MENNVEENVTTQPATVLPENIKLTKKSKLKWLFIVLILLIAILITSFGAIYFLNPKTVSTTPTIKSQTPKKSSTTTYNNRRWQFTFQYPSNWNVKETNNTIASLSDYTGYYGMFNSMQNTNDYYNSKFPSLQLTVEKSTSEEWKNISEQEFFNVNNPVWNKNVPDKNGYMPGYVYTTPKIIQINNQNIVEQTSHPLKNEELATTDDLIYDDYFWNNGVIIYFYYYIPKNTERTHAEQIRNEVLSSFKHISSDKFQNGNMVNWKLYQDNKYNIAFLYPANFTVISNFSGGEFLLKLKTQGNHQTNIYADNYEITVRSPQSITISCDNNCTQDLFDQIISTLKTIK